MKKFLMLAILFTSMMSTSCGEEAESNGTRFFNRDVIKIGLDDNFAPMGFRNKDGVIVGFDVDLARETARRMGIKVVFVPIDWDNKKEEITSKHIDMLWNGCDITDDRKEYMIFSKPYMDNRQVLLVKKGNTQRIYTIGDLEGKIIGTQTGSSAKKYIDRQENLKNSFKEFKTYVNFKEAFDDLNNDFIDVMIVDEIVARYEMKMNAGRYEIIEVTIGPATEIGIGFRKDDVELRDKVQETLDLMVNDGTAKKISEKWFQADLIKLKRNG